jgi:hypothetical protein
MPILWGIVSRVTETAISASHSIADMEALRHIYDTGLPVAERIGLELTVWGSISSAVLLILSVIAVSVLGQAIRRIAQDCRQVSENYQGLVTRWDLMRVPNDQGLLLASLAGVGVVFSLVFWAILPVTTPHPHECCAKPEVRVEPVYKPVDALNKNTQRLAAVTAQVEAMEKLKSDTKGQIEKGKGKPSGSPL